MFVCLGKDTYILYAKSNIYQAIKMKSLESIDLEVKAKLSFTSESAIELEHGNPGQPCSRETPFKSMYGGAQHLMNDDDDCYLCSPYLMEEIKDYPPRLGDYLSNALCFPFF